MDYSFHVEFQKGHHFKSTIDILNSSKTARCPIHLTTTGLEIRVPNSSNTIMYMIKMSPKNMTCTRERYFSINIKQFAKFLKNVKKKDSLTLFFTEKNPNQLGIIIQPIKQNDIPRIEKSYITVYDEDIDISIESPDNGEDGEPIYHVADPVKAFIMTTEYQRLKELKKVSKTINVKIDKNYISFTPVGEIIFGGELTFGFCPPNITYDNDFMIDHFMAIIKVSGVSTVMNFFVPNNKEYPLKISMDILDYGNMSIYIKTNEQIEVE